MEVIICNDESQVAETAADIVSAVVLKHPRATLGFATGATPEPLYRLLATRAATQVDFSELRGFALDEYVGLPLTHPASYHSVLRAQVIDPLGLDDRSFHIPDGLSDDPDRACDRFEELIRQAGGVDLQILGLGANGHLGFNEPSSSLSSRTRVKALSEQTRRDNRQFFPNDEDVPRLCVTQGLGTICDARHLVLIATGTRKARALAAAVEGPVSARCPASVVQLHPTVTVVIDEAAAVELEFTSYYREAFSAAKTRV